MILPQRIRHESDLQAFQRAYLAHGGSHLPLDYLHQSRVYALRSTNGQLHGGFILHGPSPTRTLGQAPQHCHETLLNSLQQQACCEVSGLWLAHAQRKGPWGFLLWLWAAIALMAYPTPYLCCTAAKPGLKRIYELAPAAQLVYEGPWPEQPGRSLWIYTAPKWAAIRGGLWRVLRSRQQKKRRQRQLPPVPTAKAA